MKELPPPENQIEIKQPNFTLRQLRDAFDKKDKQQLREMLDYIQNMVQRGDNMKCSPMTDKDLERLLETGEGELYVGTGTSGQRIFIKNDELWMPFTEDRDAEIGKRYHLNFEYLFDVPQVKELKVKF